MDEELFVWYSKEFAARMRSTPINTEIVDRGHHPLPFIIQPPAASNLEDDKEEAVRQLQHVLASRKTASQQNGGHSSPASESSGYMSNVSPQNRVASASPPVSSEDALDLSVSDHRRHSSSRSSPTFGGHSRSTPSPQQIKEEITGLNYPVPVVGGHLPQQPLQPRLQFNPACIQNRRDSIDLEGMRLEAAGRMPLQPPPAVLAMARPLPPPPVSLPQVIVIQIFQKFVILKN